MANFTSTHTGSVIDASVTKVSSSGVTQADLTKLNAVTSSATELNILDGVTATAAEINLLDGLTATTAELNILDGVTSTAAELNVLDGYTGSVTELNYLDTLHATGVTSTEFDFLDGVTSNIQTQLDAKIEATLTSEQVQDIVGAMFSSNTESGVTVTYEDSDGTIDLSVATQSDNNFTTTLLNKLNAIEASATADQTASEIRTLVDSASDSNVFTDADHSKLDGIEASATADQTNAEIRTAVESASDSNVFTDADHSKLNAIEASADVTDTANVTSAGALMDSELTSIADVKALDQSVVSGATPTFTTTNFTDASNKRLMTDAQETKLDSVESSADVTDTANVTSAGALMDSELTDLAGVKGVTISTLQAKPSEGAFANGDKTKLDAIESGATADQTDEEIQDVVGAMFSSNTETGITATYQDGDGTIDLVVGTLNQDTTGNAATATKIASITNSDIVQLTSSQTLTNKTLTSPVINTGVSGSAILDEDNMASNSATKLSSQQSIKAYVDAEVAGVVDSSPAALNTLNELAAALGDDANFSTTTSTALGNRLRVDTASQGLTGTQQANAITNLGITSTKAELNILDGVTSTAAELNILDGVTSTAAELNVLDGITSTTAELNILDGVTATAAELNIMDGVTATTAELNYTDGVTSNIQTQLDATLDTAGTGIDISSTTISVDVSDFMANGSNNRIVTATGTDAMNAEANLTFDGTDLAIAATGKIYLDGGGSTYITESAGDLIDIYSGGVLMMRIEESGTDSVFTMDNVRLGVGSSKDMVMYHDGTNSYIDSDVGSVNIRNILSDADIFFSVNDGGSQINALQIDASNVGQVKLPNDNQYLAIGAGQDLRFQHNGTNSFIENYTGALFMDNTVSDSDIYFRVNDGGSTVTALRIDASDAGTLLPNNNLRMGDNQKIRLGTSNDFNLYHDGSNSYIHNDGTGDIIIENLNDDKDIVLKTDDGSGGRTAYLTLDGSATRVDVSQDLRIPVDNKQFKIGAGEDLLLYHDGSNTHIQSNTAPLIINQVANSTMEFKTNNTSAMTINASQNVGIGTTSPSAKLDLGGSTSGQRLTFSNTGVNTTNGARTQAEIGYKTGSYSGAAVIKILTETAFDDSMALAFHTGTSAAEAMRINSSQNVGIGTSSPSVKLDVAGGDIAIDATQKLYLDGGSHTYIHEQADDILEIVVGNDILMKLTEAGSGIEFPQDSHPIKIGAGSDLQLNHNGTDSFVENYTGNLNIINNTDDGDIILKSDDGSGGTTAYLTLDGSATFTHLHQNTGLAEGKKLFLDGGNDTYITSDSSDLVQFFVGGAEFMRFTEDTSDTLGLYTNNTVAMTIDNSQRVGIGTTSPASKLHVSGEMKASVAQDNYAFAVENSTEQQFKYRIYNDGSTTGEPLTFRTGLYYNTTENATIHFYRGSSSLGGYMTFQTNNGNERMRIDTSGNVGIGTTSPKTKLDVENTTAPTLDNDTHAGEAIFLRSGGSDGDGNVQAVLAFGKADGSSRRSGSAIASVQTDSDVDKVGIGFYTSDSSSSSQTMDQRVLIDHVGNMRFSDNGSNPSAAANTAFLFNDGGEMKVLDELGNTTTISPHNFELIPDGASEDMAFAYHSTRHTPEGKLKKVNVDMMKLARLVEQLTGEKLVYIEEGE